MKYLIYLCFVALWLQPGGAWAREYSTIDFEMDVSYARSMLNEQRTIVGDAVTGKLHVSDDGEDYRLFLFDPESSTYVETNRTLFVKPDKDLCSLEIQWSTDAMRRMMERSVQQRQKRLLAEQLAGQPINTDHLALVTDVVDRVWHQVQFHQGWGHYNFPVSVAPMADCSVFPSRDFVQFHSPFDIEDEESLHLNMAITNVSYSMN